MATERWWNSEVCIDLFAFTNTSRFLQVNFQGFSNIMQCIISREFYFSLYKGSEIKRANNRQRPSVCTPASRHIFVNAIVCVVCFIYSALQHQRFP